MMFLVQGILYQEFRTYMARTHGHDWAAKLHEARQQSRILRCQGGSKKREDIVSSHSSPMIRELTRDAEVGVDVLRNFGRADCGGPKLEAPHSSSGGGLRILDKRWHKMELRLGFYVSSQIATASKSSASGRLKHDVVKI
jgi:hypothetical protein